MGLAYVQINSELGKGSEIEEFLKNIIEVKEIFPIYGVYDYIIKLEIQDMGDERNNSKKDKTN
jgi:DNA-binding Lrp family transcriptional regulator